MGIEAIRIRPEWKDALTENFQSTEFLKLTQELKRRKTNGALIYPPGNLIFQAFESVPPEKVKIVILGQDPYHNPGEAMGLSFSVPKGVRVPPSLVNIFRELERDLSVPISRHGDLTAWAEQGVLLLNAILTVEHNQASSHRGIGWEIFTDAVIAYLSREFKGIVFMLWGNFAKSKATLIDGEKHLVLKAAHPSPLARNAFSGCGHFSKANEYLIQQKLTPINWACPQ